MYIVRREEGVVDTVILGENALSKECKLCEGNCTRIHEKVQVCNYVLLL